MRANHDGWWPGLFHKRDFQPGMKIVGCAWWEWLHKNGFFSRWRIDKGDIWEACRTGGGSVAKFVVSVNLAVLPTTGGHTGTLRTLFLIDPIQCSLEGQEFDVGRTGSSRKSAAFRHDGCALPAFAGPLIGDFWLTCILMWSGQASAVQVALGQKIWGHCPVFSTCARTSLAPAIDIICPAPSHAAKEADDAPGLRH